jgi:hypothetical protein
VWLCVAVSFTPLWLLVQYTATITKIIYGSLIDEPRSSECGVVRDVASGLVRLAGPRHGLDRIQLGSASVELNCRWSAVNPAGR